MKKFRLALILVITFCVFLLTGCANVSYSVLENQDGTIKQAVDITLDQQQLLLAGADNADYLSIKNEVMRVMNTKKQELLDDYFDRLSKNPDLTPHQKEALKESVQIEISEEINIIRYSMNFENIGAYYLFYDYDPTKNDDEEVVEKKEGLFYSRYVQKTQTIFSNTQMVQSYVTYAKNYLQSLGVSPSMIKEPTYSYSYKTLNSKMYSDCDQRTTTEDGGVIHTWNMSADQTQREIMFFTVQPRKVVWYLFALGGALVLVGVLFLVHFLKTKKKKQDEVQVIEP